MWTVTVAYTVGDAQVPVTPDFRDFHTQVGEEADSMEARFAEAGDSSGKKFGDAFSAQVKASFASLPEATVKADADTAGLDADLDEATRDRTATIDADADTRAATAELGLVSEDRKTTVLADADTAAATVKLDTLARDRTVKINVNESGGGSPGPGGLSSLGEGGPVVIGGAAALGAALLPAAVPAAVGAGFAALGVTAAAKFNTGLQSQLSYTETLFKSMLSTAVQPLGQEFSQMLPQVNGFVQSIGPQLQEAFTASAPYLAEFITVGEQAATTLLPAFSSLLETFTPELPELGQAFASITQGLAGFLQALGPGMSASVTVFKAAADVVSFFLVAAGTLASGLALEFADAGHAISVGWSDLSGAAGRFSSAVTGAWDGAVRFFTSIPGKVEAVATGAGAWLASAGKNAVGGLLSAAESAWTGASSWFTSLPGKVEGVFSGAGGWLVSAGESMVNGLVSGIESIGGTVETALLDLVPSPVRSVVSAALGFVGFASGTPSAPPGWAWVGEQGPELVHFSGGEQVKTSSASMGMMSQMASAQSLGALSSLGVPSLAAAARLPGVSSPLAAGPLQLQLSYAGSGNQLIDVIVSSLRADIQGSAGGDVQAHLGRGKVRS
jgi:hypothetical protein